MILEIDDLEVDDDSLVDGDQDIIGALRVNTNKFTVDPATGNVVAAGTIKGASTISVGGANPSSSGAGISFPPTQNASTDPNTIDDFEEGDCLIGVGGNATYAGASGYQWARYRKLAKAVKVWWSFRIETKGTGSTGVLSGYPFPVANVGRNYAGNISSWVSSSRSCHNMTVEAVSNTSTAQCKYTDAAVSATSNFDGFQDAAGCTGELEFETTA